MNYQEFAHFKELKDKENPFSKLYETKNNHMHVQLGQILDKRYKKTKILNSNF